MDPDSNHTATSSKDDLEKNVPIVLENTESIREDSVATNGILSRLRYLVVGVAEARGIVPVPLEERTDKKGTNLFSLWFTANCSLLPIATGMSGTLIYGLSLRNSALIILFFSLLCMVPVAYMGMMGPKTGLRQMIQARYYFGIYLVVVVVLFQLATLTGYTIITAIVSGQTLAAVSGGHLSLTIGIVITALVGLAVSFMGYKVLHLYEQYSWIPTMVAVIIAIGVGGKHLFSQAETAAPTARTVLSFASICASFSISWAALVSDFSVYISPEVPRPRIFAYVFTGYLFPTIPLLILGAAIGASVPTIPAWVAANTAYSTGGVMYAMVSPLGGFGKFVAVLLAFSVIGNTACSLYSLSISLQVLLPILVRVPRYVFSVLITAIVIPISVVAANHFYASLGNFLGIIGYWTAVYIGIALTEHFYFRKGSYDSYDPSIWDVRGKLPVGAAALASSVFCFALIIPSMDAVWYTGPIAMHTGDIGIEVGVCLSSLLYIPLRTLEIRVLGR